MDFLTKGIPPHPYRANRRKLLQLAFAGFVASMASIVVAYLTLAMHLPGPDFASIWMSPLLGRIDPEPFSGSWLIGLGIHVAVGTLMLPLLFDYLTDRLILPQARWTRGLLFGVVGWVLIEGLVKTFGSYGFFSSRQEGASVLTFFSLLTMFAYGLTLDGMTRVRMVHTLSMVHSPKAA